MGHMGCIVKRKLIGQNGDLMPEQSGSTTSVSPSHAYMRTILDKQVKT